MKKKILFAITLSVVVLASVLLINTLRFTSKQIQVEPIKPVSVDESSVALRLAQALRFQTVSYQDAGQMKGEEFNIWGLADTIRTGLEGRGRQSKSAYYFLSVIATKLPLGLLALALSGLILLPMRRSPRSWRLPGLALIFLAALFIAALARGASSGGMRHALPVLVVLGVFGGLVSVFAISRRSRLARLMVVFAVVIAAASAVPRIRPWEYFNEIIGGPERAYLYFGDETRTRRCARC